MRRRHLKLLSLWILPLLLARALIPTGFMLSVDAGTLQLMFCPAGVIQPFGEPQAEQPTEHSAHHASMHHADAADEQATSHTTDPAPCPFSLVASAVPSEVPYLHDSASAPSDERFEFLSAPTVRVGPVRTERIRGPPSIA
jgi:hypothetical protein